VRTQINSSNQVSVASEVWTLECIQKTTVSYYFHRCFYDW